MEQRIILHRSINLKDDMDYKFSMYGNKIDQEVVLNDELNKISVGTLKDCQIFLKRSGFFSDFKIDITQFGDKYIASCEGEVYFISDMNPSIKEEVTVLVPGERVKVLYKGADIPFLFLDFSYEFKNNSDNYNLCIETPVGKNYVIGGLSNADICIDDEMIGNDYIVFSHLRNDMYEVDASNLRYGICVNGAYDKSLRIQLKNRQFFSICDYVFYIDGHCLFTSDNANISSNLRKSIVRESNNSYDFPRFIRSLRVRYKVPNNKLKVIPPSSKPKEPTKDYLLSMLPMLICMIGMMVLRLAMRSNSFYMIYMGIFMCSGLVVSIIRFVNSRKKYKKSIIEREEKYNAYIDRKIKKIEDSRAEENLILNRMEISAMKSLELMENFDARLFEKEMEHEDYMRVNIGQGTVKSVNQVEFTEREFLETEDELMNYPEQLHDAYEYVRDIPVMLNLKDDNAVGIVGNRDRLYAFFKNLVISLAAQHFYKDLKMFVIADEEDVDKISWVRWLKNCYDENTGKRLLIYDEDSKKTGQEYLYNLISKREQSADKKVKNTDIVVLVYRSEMISGHPINTYVKKARDLGVSFVFFEEKEEMLNHDCDECIFLEANNNGGFIQKAEDGTEQQTFSYEEIPDNRAKKAVEKIAGVYVDEMSLENRLIKSISLYEILGIFNAYDLNLDDRWNNSKVYESMAAPLGVRCDGSKLSLDIHEKAHGPHGLVAGTTGSGKSEIIQSFILSLATLFHPYEVGFIIIDFKGGGMANQFKNLPHLNGTITNIDGKQINRSLSSIKAELMKRQELFAQHEVNHIDEYIKLYKENVASVPLPHLILIVDEFAELKSEQPDFMKELISTARIGRSLGVHLILATQKPSGVVNDQIWSNSRFKLCLKVQDKRDSSEVIKSPLAAEIKEPGRAYLQVGNNEIFELFQSGYSGAHTQIDGLDERAKYSIGVVGLDGTREIVYRQGYDKDESGETQLDALVKRISEHCEERGIARLSPVCMPALAEIIPFPDKMDKKFDTNDIVLDIGVYDVPSRQSQPKAYINLTQENVAISGTAQSGKTTLLQTIIKEVAYNYSPEDVVFYIMDFATMFMSNFAGLRHVGGVAKADEPEKVKNLLKMLFSEINRRKELFSEIGVSSFGSYRDSGKKDLPQIVLMLENYTVFKEMYNDYIDLFVDICREGNSMGISVIITCQQALGYGMKILASCSRRIAMNCNDDMDYTIMLNKCKIRPDGNPGRCVMSEERECYECQIYQPFDAEKEIDRIAQIKNFIEEINSKYVAKAVKGIPIVPDEFEESYVWANYSGHKPVSYKLLFGLNYADTSPVYMDLTRDNMIAIAGKQRHTGRKNYLNYIVRTLDSDRKNAPVEIYILDTYDRFLEGCKNLESVKTYTINGEDMNKAVEAVKDKLEIRAKHLMDGDTESLENEPFIVLMVGSSEYYNQLNTDSVHLQMYRDIVRMYSTMKVAIILTDVPNSSVMFGAPEIVKLIAGFKNILMYENLGNLKVMEAPMHFHRANRKALKPGEAYLNKEGEFLKIRTPIWKEKV